MNRTQTPPKIYLTGASGAGVSTLGRVVAGELSLLYHDVDDYYWVPTDPPFTTKRPPEDRLAALTAARDQSALKDGGWVIGGSFDGWGDPLLDGGVDLIVFVYTPPDTRMARLRAREHARYGARIAAGGDMYEAHQAFIDWAAHYDHPPATHSGRSLPRHNKWLAAQTAPVLRVDGAQPVAALVQKVTAALLSYP